MSMRYAIMKGGHMPHVKDQTAEDGWLEITDEMVGSIIKPVGTTSAGYAAIAKRVRRNEGTVERLEEEIATTPSAD